MDGSTEGWGVDEGETRGGEDVEGCEVGFEGLEDFGEVGGVGEGEVG